jgi:hypothetical protein
MRAVWLAMRDEDPPDRGLADLLAAARHQAAAMQPRPSAWQRLIAALRRPPVLAFAAVTVLLAGAVLIGRRIPHEAPATSSAIAPPGDGPPAAEPAHTDPAGGGPPVRDAVPMSRPVAPAPTTAEPPARPGRSRPEPALRPGPRADDAIGTSEDRAAGPLAPEPAPPDQAPSEGAPRLGAFSDTAGAATNDPANHRANQATTAGDDLYQRSERAARRGDCATVRRLVDQILQIDPGYRARIPSDSPVARCLTL